MTIGEATSDTEKGEIFLDDTILSNSMNIITAQFEGEKKAKRLDRQKKVSGVFNEIKILKEKIDEAENNYKKAYLKIAEVAATVKHLVEDAPLPGLPVFASQDNETLNNLIKNIVIVPDADEPFLLKDVGLAGLIGKETRIINETFQRKNLKPNQRPQNIDIICDLALPESYGGHQSKLYSLKNVLNFIDSVEPEYLKKGATRADKDLFKDLIQNAFTIFKSRCDTSPLRKRANLAQTEVRTIEGVIKDLKSELKDLEAKKVELEERLQTFKVDKNAFEDMRDSGLFTEFELKDPQQVKVKLKGDAAEFEKNKKNADEAIRPLHSQYLLYQQFSKEYPREHPDDHLQVIEAEEARLDELFQTTKVYRKNALKELSPIEIEFKGLDVQLQTVKKEYENIQKVQPGYLACTESFPDEEIIGFEQRIHEKRGYFIKEITRREPVLDQAKRGYSLELKFYKLEGEVDPAEWLIKVDKERALLTSRADIVQNEITQYEAELDLLKQNKVAPGPNASKALKLIPDHIQYEPLHSFIKHHTESPDRAEEFLTLFSSFLFAPVIQGEDNISSVLNIFTKKKEDILLPVFHEESLKGLLQNKNLEIKKAAGDVFYLIAGKKTDLVECILDPEKREQRKIFVESQLVEKRQESGQIKDRLTAISSTSTIVTLAQNAKNSKDSQFGQRIERIAKEIESLKEEKELYQEKYTDLVMKYVKDAEIFVLLGGPEKYAELYSKLVLFQKRHDTLSDSITDLKDKIAKLTEDAEKYSQDLAKYKEENNTKKNNLKALREFLPDGLETYTSLKETIDDCEDKLLTIRRKQDYDLNRAATYVATLAINSETDLQNQFKEIEKKRLTLSGRITDRGKKRGELEGKFKLYSKNSEEYDRFLSSVTALYKRALKNIRSITENDTVDLSYIMSVAHELQSSLHEEQIDFASVHGKAQEISGSLEKDNFEVLNNKASSARNHVSDCEISFQKRCDEEIRASGMDAILNQGEKELIREIKKAPEQIISLADHFEKTLNQEIEDFTRAKEHEKKLRDTLAGSLTSLTDKAIANFQTLKRILKGTEGSAAYFIKAEIASRENIESSIDNIIEMVKSAHERYTRDKEDPFRDSNKSEDDEHQKNLKERISEKCYRSIFLNPTIKYKHPDIRGGNVTEFNISEKFKGISEGEKTSLALLMYVVMARYAQRRKINEEFGQGIRRHRDAAESPNVLIIDGLFSSLSKPSLIKQAFSTIETTQGAFQIIGLIHNPTYVGTHDFNVFPNLFIGRTYTDASSNDSEGWVAFDHQQKEMMGQIGFANFQAKKK
ncbi:hypothetical protein [Desulfopila sp. IMCC35008]|uniref:hypothetical protein n=1 Tax=Desulfopila sp. IMCC35008 TaxID=2653858 RepID=UPI0013D803CD|nr:hypothetical protein [Desulfopila sp. IMCC35008]